MTGTLPKAIMLDLDDTILAFDVVADEAWQAVCREFAPLAGGYDAETLLDAIQRFRTWFWSDPKRARRGRLDLDLAWRETAEGALASIGVSAPAVVDRMARAYSARRDALVRPIAGALEALQALNQSGCRLALVPNGGAERQRGKILRFDLSRYFDFILIEGEFGTGKPGARVYRHVLERLGADPADAWMVGDSLEFDVEGAQRVGVFGVWVDSDGLGPPQSSAVRPDRSVRSLAELVSQDRAGQEWRRDCRGRKG